ncbi:energy-coupling factor transporter ATPase [Clostridiaceae bacterium JG1575]|nr:energy-coupling factor transporter ATPase [Clostridiaceae bacterium JG1575]
MDTTTQKPNHTSGLMMIQTEHLTHYYDEFDAQGNEVTPQEGAIRYSIKDITLSVPKGQFLCILGHNGSGKSTLAKHFNALLLPVSGTILVDGIDAANPENTWQVRSRAGMVFQNPDNQMVATIVEEDVAFGCENLGVAPQEIRRRVDQALKDVNMYEFRKHAPHLLSGGQKQRVAIAGILAMRPECIIFDEPTAMLDPAGRREVMATVRELNRTFGITVIHITHYMEEAVLADRIVVVDEGQIVMDDVPKNIFSQVAHMKSLGLDVPQVTEVAHLLSQRGIPLDAHLLTIDELVEALCQYKQNM